MVTLSRQCCRVPSFAVRYMLAWTVVACRAQCWISGDCLAAYLWCSQTVTCLRKLSPVYGNCYGMFLLEFTKKDFFLINLLSKCAPLRPNSQLIIYAIMYLLLIVRSWNFPKIILTGKGLCFDQNPTWLRQCRSWWWRRWIRHCRRRIPPDGPWWRRPPLPPPPPVWQCTHPSNLLSWKTHRVITPRGAKDCRLLYYQNILPIFIGSQHWACAYFSWFKAEGWKYFCRFVFVCLTLTSWTSVNSTI